MSLGFVVEREALPQVRRRAAKLRQPSPERACDLWQSFRPQHQEADHEDDDELLRPDSEHGLMLALRDRAGVIAVVHLR